MAFSLILVFILSYLAFSISAICGGGAGLLLLPLLGRTVAISQVPAALSIGTFSSSASRLLLFYKKINWGIVKYFVPAALPAVWLGAWLLRFINPLYLEIVLGIFLVSNLPFIFRSTKGESLSEQPKNSLLLLIGFVAGFLSGLTGAVGLLFNRFYLRYGMSKEEIIATRAANEIVLHLFKLVLYGLFGLITSNVIGVGIVVAIAAISSSLSIRFILPLISENAFRKIGYSAMVVSGILLIGQSLTSLLIDNNGQVNTTLVEKGIESKLQWQNSNYALEFTYDEGFEFEQQVPLNSLTDEQQSFVKNQFPSSDRIVIESVYGIEGNGLEAYYFKNNTLIVKIDF
ncbi:MAG: hypothetical protein RLZZ543_1273 [Bacteroidota bacterium]